MVIHSRPGLAGIIWDKLSVSRTTPLSVRVRVVDTTVRLQGSSGVHALKGWGCFENKRGVECSLLGCDMRT